METAGNFHFLHLESDSLTDSRKMESWTSISFRSSLQIGNLLSFTLGLFSIVRWLIMLIIVTYSTSNSPPQKSLPFNFAAKNLELTATCHRSYATWKRSVISLFIIHCNISQFFFNVSNNFSRSAIAFCQQLVALQPWKQHLILLTFLNFLELHPHLIAT